MKKFIKAEGSLEFGDIDVLMGVVQNLVDSGHLKKINPKFYQWQGTREIPNQMQSHNEIISAVSFGDFSLKMGGCFYGKDFVAKVENILGIASKGFFLRQNELNELRISKWHDGKHEVISGCDALLDAIGDPTPIENDTFLLDEPSWNAKYKKSLFLKGETAPSTYNDAIEYVLDQAFMIIGNDLSQNQEVIPSDTVAGIIKLEVAKKFFELDDDTSRDEAISKYDQVVDYLEGDSGVDDIESIEFLEWLDDTTIDVIFDLMETEYARLLVLIKTMDELYEKDKFDASISVTDAEVCWVLRGSVTADKRVLDVMRLP